MWCTSNSWYKNVRAGFCYQQIWVQRFLVGKIPSSNRDSNIQYWLNVLQQISSHLASTSNTFIQMNLGHFENCYFLTITRLYYWNISSLWFTGKLSVGNIQCLALKGTLEICWYKRILLSAKYLREIRLCFKKCQNWIHPSNNTDTGISSAVLITIYLVNSMTSAWLSECLQILPNSWKAKENYTMFAKLCWKFLTLENPGLYWKLL